MRVYTLMLPAALAATVVAVSATVPASAQDQTMRAIDVPAGKVSQLSIHSGANADCTPKPLADIRVDTMPTAGTLAVRDAKVRVRNGTCAGKEFPARVVLYQAPARPGATDSATYTVTSGTRVSVFGVNITVIAPGAKPAR